MTEQEATVEDGKIWGCDGTVRCNFRLVMWCGTCEKKNGPILVPFLQMVLETNDGDTQIWQCGKCKSRFRITVKRVDE